jgi:divalent metal cation (Fe/Co/Zn/Cd) transporter
MPRTARYLLLFTIVYNLAEGIIAVSAGIAAGSIALVAFGADSYLEIAAASLVFWRLTVSESRASERAEELVERFIGWTFLALAAVIAIQVVWSVAGQDGAGESLVGIGLAIASVTVMPAVAIWKLRAAAAGNVPSLAAEAKETLACSYLSVTLLVGLVANALLGWWWLDPVTALLLIPWLVREGLEGIRGEDEDDEEVRLCACRACLFGLRKCSSNCCIA